MVEERSFITLQQATEILNISEATLRNWVKQQYLTPDKTSRVLLFDFHEVCTLRANILKGKLNKLQGRANKNNSTFTYIPSELVPQSEIGSLNDLIIAIKSVGIPAETAVFLLGLNLLRREGLLEFYFSPNGFELESVGNQILLKEIEEWKKIINKKIRLKDVFLTEITLPNVPDILGTVYQSMLPEGKKWKAGSYYTPFQVIRQMVEDNLPTSSHSLKILDPCCGSGMFLTAVINRMKNLGLQPEGNQIWGFDIDRLAVKIARINCYILMKENNLFSPSIFHLDSLKEKIPGLVRGKENFDLVVSNPPWGSTIDDKSLSKVRKDYPEIKTSESFSFFLRKSIDLLKPGGTLSFILPESLLHVKQHEDIRAFILQQCRISSIFQLDRLFKNVFTKVIRLDLKKEKSSGNLITIATGSETYTVRQEAFLQNPHLKFNIQCSEKDQQILSKIFARPFTTLKGKADWALGIVTGDNKKYLADKSLPGTEGVVKGNDVFRFRLKTASCFLKFNKEKLQQTAPLEKYKTEEKLVYRFIASYPVIAYDNHGLLTLNSANIIIPKVEGYSMKTIMALFNSGIYAFIYTSLFSEIKVLRSSLEELPLPLLSEYEVLEIQEITDSILEKGETETQLNTLDEKVARLFNLTDSELEYIRNKIKRKYEPQLIR